MGAEVIAVARGSDKPGGGEGRRGTPPAGRADGRPSREVKALGGADVVYDAVGGQMFTRRDARHQSRGPHPRQSASRADRLPQIVPNHLLVKNIDVIGFYWGGYMRFGAAHLADSLKALMDMYEAGRIRPHVGATRPLDRKAPRRWTCLRDRAGRRQGRRGR